MKCEECRVWRPEPPPPEGRCHRYPPSVGGTWPLTLSHEWCGEFSPPDERAERGADGGTGLAAEGIRRAVVSAVNMIMDEGLDPDDPATPPKRLREDLGWDSLDRAEIVMEVEDELDIDFSLELEESISTVGDIVNAAARLARAKGGAA